MTSLLEEDTTDNEKPTFEKVWAILQETARQQEERDRTMEELKRQIGGLGNSFGELAEHLVAPSIMEKFNELGFHFDNSSRDHDITERRNPNVYAEIDILLENDEFAVAVEIKAKPKQKDVDDHLRRMEILRRRADRHRDSRKYQGAIAGAIMSSEVRDYIHRQGLYAIVQTGDTVRIDVPEGFKPREW